MYATTTINPMEGCSVLEPETVEVMFATGVPSPKPVVAPPKSGLLAFKMIGGMPDPVGTAPVEDAVVGAAGYVVTGDTVAGGVRAGFTVTGDTVAGGVTVTGDTVTGGVTVIGDTVGGVRAGLTVTGDAAVGDVEAADVTNTHEAELGFILVMTAAPPKSQLVGTGFRW